MLSNAYFLAKFRFDTAENEPAKKLQNLNFAENIANGLQVLARLAARHAQLELVFLDGMPAELAREFGYASVGFVHDMCCETFSSSGLFIVRFATEQNVRFFLPNEIDT